tara:strand:+ start:240 stop:575 length:336 start_codon:yes stop_codon:yes gene_type:complete
MSDYLNKKDIDQLMRLFNAIKLDLSDSSFPTRTNRLEAVENMAKVLEIHGWKAIRNPEISVEPSKSQEEEMTAEELSEDKHQGREEIPMPFPDATDQHLINRNFNKATGGK